MTEDGSVAIIVEFRWPNAAGRVASGWQNEENEWLDDCRDVSPGDAARDDARLLLVMLISAPNAGKTQHCERERDLT